MTVRVVASIAVVAIGLTVAASMTMAQTAPHVGDGSGPGYVAAQHKLTTEPGYSVGTGAAHVGSPGTSWAAKQRELRAEPGYSIGTGSAEIKDKP